LVKWITAAAQVFIVLLLPYHPLMGWAQTGQTQTSQLKFVIILSRHGVRSPTGKVGKLNLYSAEPWPQWDVPPGHLTARGSQLMTIFGGYDRAYFVQQRLLFAKGCADTRHVSFIADSDQRTVATGRALATGMFPDCSVEVQALPRSTPNPLFHPLAAHVGHPDHAFAAAAVSGRIGDNPAGLVEAYRSSLIEMEKVLLNCSSEVRCPPEGTLANKSLFSLKSSIGPGTGDHLVDLQGPLSVASTIAEDMLLEYTDGMSDQNVGWGRLDAATLNQILVIHTAHAGLLDQTPYIARVQASNIMSHILATMEQAVEQKDVAGALGKPGDKVVFLIGHDTNIANVAGLLGLSWLVDGRQDATPPGGALVFEVWSSKERGIYFVRAYYESQTLEQMRTLVPLSLDRPPVRANIFLPGCSTQDREYSCKWNEFKQTVKNVIDPAFVQ
jgi:4-phytase/acid phosphatase